MRLVNIANVVSLACLIYRFYVNSQLIICEKGWFGLNCKLKCRCQNYSCNNEGRCTNSLTCQRGWFGPSCQYVDLAFNMSDNPLVTDGNDSTCLTPGSTSNVTLNMFTAWPFTWLRVHVKIENVVNNLSVGFMNNSVPVACTNLKAYEVDDKTMDVHCNLTKTFDEVVLVGDAIQYLCSVYISGERNLALKENATQSTTYSENSANTSNVEVVFRASLAVDGYKQSDLYIAPYCASTRNVANSSWELFLSKPRRVNRYRIFNRGVSTQILSFRLESFDVRNILLVNYTDRHTGALNFFDVTNQLATVQRIRIRPSPSERMLTLCEVEIFGDSICEKGKYGFDCHRDCRCRVNEHCTVSTGLCPSGCTTGYRGLECALSCRIDTYGEGCNSSCTDNCLQPNRTDTTSCNHITGMCLYGCRQVGFTGSHCTQECGKGTYGQGCQEECSQECVASRNPLESSCDHVNGSCLYGCQSGYIGVTCVDKCPTGKFGVGCKQSCSDRCAHSNNPSTSSCYHVDGICRFGCEHGATGAFCSDVSFALYSEDSGHREHICGCRLDFLHPLLPVH